MQEFQFYIMFKMMSKVELLQCRLRSGKDESSNKKVPLKHTTYWSTSITNYKKKKYPLAVPSPTRYFFGSMGGW